MEPPTNPWVKYWLKEQDFKQENWDKNMGFFLRESAEVFPLAEKETLLEKITSLFPDLNPMPQPSY